MSSDFKPLANCSLSTSLSIFQAKWMIMPLFSINYLENIPLKLKTPQFQKHGNRKVHLVPKEEKKSMDYISESTACSTTRQLILQHHFRRHSIEALWISCWSFLHGVRVVLLAVVDSCGLTSGIDSCRSDCQSCSGRKCGWNGLSCKMEKSDQLITNEHQAWSYTAI